LQPDEIDTDVALVRRLRAAQFPQWADLPVTPVELAGWDNTTFPPVLRKLATLLARRWPTWIALAVVAVTVADGGPLPLDLFAWLTLVMPPAYLGFGAARKDLQPAAMLMLQLAALGFYVGLTAVALSVDDDLARYLLALGWIAHAFWDGVFFHANRVVPRPWAEWCGVVDLCLGGAILFLG
jgi:hypothetical protein